MKPSVAILGASANRSKYGNKAVRAFVAAGFDVYPVHPTEPVIEGLQAYPSIASVPVTPDRASLYLPPEVGIRLLREIVERGVRELWLNPGSESPELIEAARGLGLEVIQACSIVGVGRSPREFTD